MKRLIALLVCVVLCGLVWAQLGTLNDRTARRLADWRVRYESEKKDHEIDVLRRNQEFQRIVRNVMLGGSALHGVLVLMLFNRNRLKTRAKLEMRRPTMSWNRRRPSGRRRPDSAAAGVPQPRAQLCRCDAGNNRRQRSRYQNGPTA